MQSENDEKYGNNTGPTDVGEKKKQHIQEEENDENYHPSKMPGILNAGLGHEGIRIFENHTTSTTKSDNNFEEAVAVSKTLPNSKFK